MVKFDKMIDWFPLLCNKFQKMGVLKVLKRANETVKVKHGGIFQVNCRVVLIGQEHRE